jgi:hypothetical protein
VRLSNEPVRGEYEMPEPENPEKEILERKNRKGNPGKEILERKSRKKKMIIQVNE